MRVLQPLGNVVTYVAELIHIIRVDARVDGKLLKLLADYERKHGIAGLIKWLESPGDAV